MHVSPALLLVESNEGHRFLIEEKFRGAFPDAEIFSASTLQEASELLPSKSWDLVIINWKLPDGIATDLLDRLSERHPFAAVAILTEELTDPNLEISGHSGAVEFLTKDRSTLDSFVSRVQRLMAASKRMNALLHEREDLNEGMLFRDALTGAYNRAYLEDTLRREVSRCNRHQYDLSFLMIDVDGFERLNREKGLLFGEQCLKRLASILTRAVRSGDVVARYDQDEFAMLLSHCRKSDAVRCARRVLDTVKKQSASHRFTVSIGVMHYRGASPKIHRLHKPQDILARAAKALQEARSRGGAQMRLASGV
ncbi:MAG TPA: GGDEF domain-containing response regulator [bacterium]|nr:GGDEF domain-containing response regulator [bacterium]